jgi:cytochrome c
MNRAIATRCSLFVVLTFSAFLLFSSNLPTFGAPPNPGQGNDSAKTWVAPDPATIPAGPLGDTIRLGMQIFNNTPKYAEKYVGNKMSCTHCHIDGGTVSLGMPMVGLPGIFPMYRDREKTVITFEERIEQCFQRSETGHRVPNDGPEMTGLVAYVQWLSKDQVSGHPFPGRGLVNLPELTGTRSGEAKSSRSNAVFAMARTARENFPWRPPCGGRTPSATAPG